MKSITCVFIGYLYSVKGYMLLYPSTDRLIIERCIQFEETPLHAPSKPHEGTFVQIPTPDISDYDPTHSYHVLYMSLEFDLEDNEHVYEDHVDAKKP